MLFGLFALYAASGPAVWLWRRMLRLRRPSRPGGGQPPA
jgi:hypothetical protein